MAHVRELVEDVLGFAMTVNGALVSAARPNPRDPEKLTNLRIDGMEFVFRIPFKEWHQWWTHPTQEAPRTRR